MTFGSGASRTASTGGTTRTGALRPALPARANTARPLPGLCPTVSSGATAFRVAPSAPAAASWALASCQRTAMTSAAFSAVRLVSR